MFHGGRGSVYLESEGLGVSREVESGMVLEDVIPIVVGRTETVDRRVEGDHLLSHRIACGVGIETAVDGNALRQECGKPERIGPSSRSGYTARRRMQEKATHGVDGRFAEHDHRGIRGVDGEVAEIFLRTGRHAAPAFRSGAAQFGADGAVFFSK